MMMYVVRVDIFEKATGYRYPVVTHLFHGKTPDEAHRYHEAHLSADAFLRECEQRGLYERRVPCKTVLTEGWVET